MPYQSIYVKSFKNTRTAYTLSGFAKLDTAAETHNENLRFRLRASVCYVQGESSGDEPWHYEDHVAEFSQTTNEWQYASVTFTKKQFRTIDHIDVICDYFDPVSGSTNTYAYFDSVALTVGETEYDLTAEDFSVTNSHDDDTNTLETEESTGFKEVMARYNIPLTETTYSDESLHAIYNSKWPCDGFIAFSETYDSRGNKTAYTVDEDTSRVTEVTDREGNVTTYGYDAAGNVTQICEYDEDSDAMVGVNLTYDAFNELESVTRSDGMTYRYGYNEFHRLESVGIDGKTAPLVQYAYKNRNGSLKTITYANGDSANLTYDRFGRPVREVWKNSAGTVTQDTKYSYDGNGNPVSVLDITNETEYTYVYENGRIVCEMQSEGAYISSNGYKYAGTLVCKTMYRYNADGRIAEKTVCDSSGEMLEKYTYTDKGEATVTLSSGAKVRSRNDALGRVAFDEIQTGENAVSRKFEYHDGAYSEVHEMCGGEHSAPTTELVERISYSDGDELEYTYDKEERITSVVGKHTNEYEYDSHGQLTKETYTDSDGDTTVTDVTYDSVGNILTKGGKTYRYRSSVWFDLLTDYDGKIIRYDEAGNPTSYLGSAMTWTAGRKLSSYANENGEAYYTYNSLGQRIEKTVNGDKHTYIYEGHRLVKEIITDTDGSVNTLVFFYDSADSPIGMQYNGIAYYYKKNLQGDVIGLINASGETIAEYIYDAWGALREPVDANSIAALNPIRYRGYYYDNETGFYFLQSRYYNPVVGRFINADETLFLGVSGTVCSYNLYAYCGNDAVNRIDPTGMLSVSAIVKFVKTIGSKAWKIIASIWKAFVQPGKINLKPFEIVIDVLVGIFVPSLSSALKLLTYKAVNKKLVQIAFKNAGKSFINLLTKLGINVGLNTLFAAAVNNLIFKHMSRFLTVGGIICLVFDVIDGQIDYWFNYGRIFN